MNNLSDSPVNWFYVLDSRRHGPFDRANLVRELLSLEAPEDVLVWRTGLLAWTEAGMLDELKRELPPPLPGALASAAEASTLALPDLPEDDDEGGEATDPNKATDSVSDGASVGGTDEAGAEAGSAADQRRRRRRHRAPRTAGQPSYLLPLVLLFLAVMLGLWFLLRRLNEVPPGRIIQQSDLGVGVAKVAGLGVGRCWKRVRSERNSIDRRMVLP